MEKILMKIKAMRLNVTVAAVVTTILGILLLVKPDGILGIFARIIAVILIIAGVGIMLTKRIDNSKNVIGLIVGGVVALIGVWAFIKPNALVSLIPIVMGVILFAHGVQDLSMGIEVIKAKGERGWIILLGAILNMILGILCIINAFGIVMFGVQLIGIMLIYDGITDMFIVHKVKKHVDVVDSTIISEEDIY